MYDIIFIKILLGVNDGNKNRIVFEVMILWIVKLKK